MARKFTDQEFIIRVSSLLRATRKHLDLNQTTVARHLGVDQSVFSKMEHGKVMLNVNQWLNFCQLTGISSESLATNQIELGQFESGIKLPARYSYDKCATVRVILPLLEFGKKTFGPQLLNAFFHEKKIDPDYFIDLNARINFNFPTDLVEALLRKTGMHPKELELMTRDANRAKNHGSLQHVYNHLATHQFSLIQSFVDSSLNYTGLWKFEILDRCKETIHLSVTQNPAMDRFKLRAHSVFGDLVGDYTRGFIRNFSAYGGQKPLKIELLEAHHVKTSRYLYQLSMDGN